MKKVLILALTIMYGVLAHGNDSLKTRLPHFLTINTTDGEVFPTNDFVRGDYRTPHFSSFALKYGFTSNDNSWKNIVYGSPYGGIGLYVVNFYRENELGTPFSLFFFQGAEIYRFNPKVSVNYEWNLGGSFNWRHYDPFDNPDNTALGSTVNVHVAGNIYAKWKLNRKIDLNAGVSVTHFSNGASALPNNGINMAGLFLELSYHFNREEIHAEITHSYDIPPFEKRIDHDAMFMITSRHAKVDTLGTGLASEYTHRKFKVLGLSYSYMMANSYRYKWGPSIEATYDESSGIRSWREKHPENGKFYDRIQLGNVFKRFSVGMSVKGEMSMPYYSVFANLGYDILHGNSKDKRLYQIVGIKVYLKDNMFGTFGIRATSFQKAQYLYWNLGYTIPQKR